MFLLPEIDLCFLKAATRWKKVFFRYVLLLTTSPTLKYFTITGPVLKKTVHKTLRISLYKCTNHSVVAIIGCPSRCLS